MNRWWLNLVSSFTMVVFTSTAMFAGSGAAMLYPTGMVLLNGNAVPSATAIFKGDVITTSVGSIAAFSAPNSQISITAQTTLKMSDRSVNLENGVVTVDTKGGFVTEAAAYTVSPSSPSGRYRVLRHGDAILVASLEGPLTVKWGSNSTMVASGASWASPQDSDSGQQGPQPTPTATMPDEDKRRLKTGTLILIGVGMGGLAAGLALSASSGHAISPVRP